MWEGRESGLMNPAGITSDLTHSSSQTYLQIKGKAVALRQLYVDSAIALPATCGLATLIADAIELSDSWLTAPAETIPVERLFRAAQLDRIAEAALPLRNRSVERVPDGRDLQRFARRLHRAV